MAIEARIEFLYNAIKDAQELIRFIDTKTAFVVSILGAYILVFFSAAGSILKNYQEFGIVFWISFFLFLILVILSIIVTTRIIKPTNDPMGNIQVNKENITDLKFYLDSITYGNELLFPFYNSRNFKLAVSFESFYQSLLNSDEEIIQKCLSVELLKVSYIRNVKTSRFHVLLWLLVLTSVVFFIAFIAYSLEVN